MAKVCKKPKVPSSKPVDLWCHPSDAWQFLHPFHSPEDQPITHERTSYPWRPSWRESLQRLQQLCQDSLSYILQKCPRTHGPRIQRHNSIARLITDTCISQGWQVSWAPRLRTSYGLKKPDLIITKQNKIAVVDVTVV